MKLTRYLALAGTAAGFLTLASVVSASDNSNTSGSGSERSGNRMNSGSTMEDTSSSRANQNTRNYSSGNDPMYQRAM